jgi:DNA-binding GntR family transcriptional regulator
MSMEPAFESPIVAQSLANLAFEKIAAAIASGEIAPGARISEAELARKFGISRGPLREALMRLEGRRLVERRLNLGAYVVGLSERGLDELFTMREALEGMACRLAATAMTDAEIAELSNYLHCFNHDDRAATPEYYQALEDFHVRIVRGSGNERLIAACCDELFYQFRVYRFQASVQPGARAQAACAEHQRIIDALTARDPDRAEAEMRRHLAQVRANLIWRAPEEVRRRA